MNKSILALMPALLLLMCHDLKAQTTDCKTLLAEQGKQCAYPRLSAGEEKILFQSNASGTWQLKVMDIATREITALTNDPFNNNFPDWSVDNQWVAFVSDRDGNEDIYMMKTDGTGLKRITNDPERDIHPYFSPDGKYLLFNSTRGNGSLDIYRYTISSGKTEQLTNTSEHETCARYSPDMKTIVYLKNDPRIDDVFMLDTSSFQSTNITNTPGIRDGWPMFSRDGTHIYFSSLEKGSFSIYRVNSDGTEKMQLTDAPRTEEHGRVFVSADEKLIVYNINQGGTIAIAICQVS
jgi:TolB protein